MMRKAIIGMLAALAAGQAFAQPARPSPFWFGKVVTAERSRQFYVGLDTSMWVLYDLPQAVLYRAWHGGDAGGSLQNASPSVTPEYWFGGGPHFPHIFVPEGADYFHDQVGEYFASYTKPTDIDTYYTKWPKQPRNYQAWAVFKGNADAGAKVRYRGYSVAGKVFTLDFSLVLPDGSEIKVTESPEYASAGGKHNLARTFTFAGIPAGSQVRLSKTGGAAAAWTVTSGSASLSAGTMIQTADGKTVLTGSW